MAVNAIQQGAYDFIEVPFPPERLVEVCRRALEQRRLNPRSAQPAPPAGWPPDAGRTHHLGHSPAIRALRTLIANVADTAANVLIEGETGAGKELVARCLHDFSSRRDKEFVAINCGGLQKIYSRAKSSATKRTPLPAPTSGASAKSNTPISGLIFFWMKWKACRSICRSSCCACCKSASWSGWLNSAVAVDCRVIAATKSDLEAMGRDGHFRSDFYYRLNVVTLELPPLLERREDIPLLFEHFFQTSRIAL